MRPSLTTHELATLAVISLPAFAGLGLLIFGSCKFSIGQLLASLFTYGLALSFFFEDESLDPQRKISWAIATALAVILGLFIGARAAAKIDPKQTRRRWLYFFAGFLFLPSGFISLGCFLIVWLAHAPRSDVFWLTAISGWSIAAFSIPIVLHCFSMKTFKAKDSTS